MLTLYGPDGEVAVPLLPKRALVLAQELLTCGVAAIKADSWDAMYEQGAPQRGPDLRAAGCTRALDRALAGTRCAPLIRAPTGPPDPP